MTEQSPLQPDRSSGAAEGLSTFQRKELDRRRADLSRAYAGLSEVMSEEEQRAFGLNVDLLSDVLNERQ